MTDQKLIWSYGCVRCQKNHHEGDALYEPHHGWQDKHGSRQVPISHSLIGKLPVEFNRDGRLEGDPCEWDGSLPRDCWCWLIRRRDKIHCMGFFSRMVGWRVADSIGRTVLMSPSKVARLYERGGRVIDPFDLEVVMVGDCGFYVPKGIKEEIERLRRTA